MPEQLSIMEVDIMPELHWERKILTMGDKAVALRKRQLTKRIAQHKKELELTQKNIERCEHKLLFLHNQGVLDGQ